MLGPDGGERQQEQVQTHTARSVEHGETLNELTSFMFGRNFEDTLQNVV